MLTLKKVHSTKPLDLSTLERKKAFLGYITKKARSKAIDLLPDESGIILDIATGNGLFLIDLEYRYSHEYYLMGLDINFHLLEEAKSISAINKINNINLINGDAFSLPFKDNSSSITLCLNTFLNIRTFDEVSAILKELIRITKPGGKVIFDIRNKSNILLSLKYLLHTFLKTYATSSYKISQFSDFLRNQNIEITNIEPIGLNHPLFALDYIIVVQKQ